MSEAHPPRPDRLAASGRRERSEREAGEGRGIFVTGTDTGIGKTFVACALLRALVASGA
jgi:hypothetical protein